ncbi:MAG: flagellar basal body rod C-terminal domain-containing protein, partial [Hyphomonadaceae bacterium]
AAVIDQLASILDIRVEATPEGGVTVRTSGGALLVGAEAAQISYTPSGASFATHGVIQLNAQLGAASNLEPYLVSGELKGLLQARDTDLPALAEALGGFAGALADQLNAVHNENASTPAVSQMKGRQTGLLGTDALNFKGAASLGVVDSTGALAQKLTIDFAAGTITGAAPAATYAFSNSIDSFAAALNSALAAATPAGSATFANGVLSLNVGAGGGLVVQQDSANPSDRAGRGFSHFFGLNDVIARPAPYFFEAGVSSTDLLSMASGQQITFQVTDANGRYSATRTLTISGALAAPGATMGDLINALNAPVTGVGEYATFALDAKGRLTMTPRPGFTPTITSDSTVRGGTGVSLSGLFGLTAGATAARALEINVAPAIAADPGRLAVGRPDLSAAIGSRVIEGGDNRGAAALVAARDKTYTFSAAGALGAQTTTMGLYASRLGGVAGRLANDAANAAVAANAVSSAAADRRSQVEGVNIDDELVRMTAYQNSYAAAARVIQAASDMFDILLTIGAR